MLTLRFAVAPGEALVCSRAVCFRFSADGTLRGGDNSVAAQRGTGGWRIGQRLYRELECAGPVILTARRTRANNTVRHGPFNLVRTSAGLLIADDASLGIYLPTWEDMISVSWHEVVLRQAPATL